MKGVLFAFFFFFVGIAVGWAQGFTVTGKVIDNEGLEVIGGSVTIKNAKGGTITDMSGNYSIQVNDASKDVLVFSYIGMKTVEVPVKGQKQINVTLQPDNQLLEEVVRYENGGSSSKRTETNQCHFAARQSVAGRSSRSRVCHDETQGPDRFGCFGEE